MGENKNKNCGNYIVVPARKLLAPVGPRFSFSLLIGQKKFKRDNEK